MANKVDGEQKKERGTRRFPILNDADNQAIAPDLSKIVANGPPGQRAAFLRALVVIGYSIRNADANPLGHKNEEGS